MKLIVTVVMGMAVLLVTGCQKSDTEAKMAELEARIIGVEARIEGLPEVFEGISEGIKTNTIVLQTAMADLKRVQEENRDLEGLLEELVRVKTNAPTAKMAPRVAYVPTALVSGALSSPATAQGVPDQVLREIKEEARRRWPESYTMQEYVIGREMEAYRKVKGR